MRPERTASGTLTVPFTVPASAGDVKAISSEQAAQTRATLRNDFGVVIAVDGHRTVSALTLSKVVAPRQAALVRYSSDWNDIDGRRCPTNGSRSGTYRRRFPAVQMEISSVVTE